ncbi:hypothetical protein PHLGIDRAFT_482064 [Phlebiopsis gigantea 11061_1 CR5-6]|uniref:NEDD8-activating enzyme E1 regulatory subunit n=1 Tax=Phlebiopsis gigantea (strain 11061_1 CR5-6) TaxID=745531 RepID=A0A0C3S5Y9_PHLG1|nr:hypothetical protein PHLGIDRAFT_482064 [Phlebiopsis gigantea 11061_1 CR5-6]
MLQNESQDIEAATATLQAQPDSKTRRYDRQLRLWAASGQAALEAARILVTSGSATSTSVLKNLVLPGIGHFTILDASTTAPADAGNNFFLNADASIGKPRAAEAVPLLRELNDSVDGVADVRDLAALLDTPEGRQFVAGFSLVIAHNLPKTTVEKLADLLWQDPLYPPLMVVRSAGFLADFYIQFHEHCVIESHSETAPALRLTKPFPALQAWADSTDYDTLDPTEHAHIPFVIILIKEADKWRAEHNGALPKAYAEQKAFKAAVLARQKKLDEENFEEAEAQAVRLWTEKGVPSDVQALLDLPALAPDASPNVAFHALLQTLRAFVSDPAGPGTLPLTATLPDMKTDTESYVRLQWQYKEQARVENVRFKELLRATHPDVSIDDALADAFVKNAHHIKLLRGRPFGAFARDAAALASALDMAPKETLTHLGLNALSAVLERSAEVTPEALTAEIQAAVGAGVVLPEDELENVVEELARAPTADLPNTAAFLGGMLAQEAIKMVTKQYVPVNGYCVVDLIGSTTGVVGAV